MKIAVVGAGFTGLSCAYYLSAKGITVDVYESSKDPGGLAGSFKHNGWEYPLEMHYHHWFDNDHFLKRLVADLGIERKLGFSPAVTSLYSLGGKYPLDSPIGLMTFPHLGIIDKVRTGAVLAFLKLLPSFLANRLESQTAYRWLNKYIGKKSFGILFEPLFEGKFKKYARLINMTWFWARIKKRTKKLGYLKGGYSFLTGILSDRLREKGVKIFYSTAFQEKLIKEYDRIVFTAPTRVFLDFFSGSMPAAYKKRLQQIEHLHAATMVLVTKEKILDKEYWLNINDSSFPFIGVIQHTNFVDKKHYSGDHITYIANYLPDNHPFLKMDEKELLNIYGPYIAKISPSYKKDTLKKVFLFKSSNAQPVFTTDYSGIIPEFETPIRKVILANMDMVYPWDRGTNYAIELGKKAADYVLKLNI